eukprot:TRINITY_DN53928_c0_g1_i1.p1 TRINITY_DN53928_c0_g1~~TRINITY_DN53928_c0_g1_i1.p1  ORF type:complete len:583 (-),score=96.93 TRINITY_DN53928_c0_g1_i1:831-2579(-)
MNATGASLEATSKLPTTRGDVLAVDDEFRDKCAVDMSGMKFPDQRQLETGFPPLKSLEDLDENAEWSRGVILIDSPRSVEACLRLGVNPPELLKTKLVIPAGTDPNLAKVQYIHKERRRKQKLKALKEERHHLMGEGAGIVKEHNANLASTMLDLEEQRMQRILAANQSQLRQQLLHDERMKKKVKDREEKVAQQRERDEQNRINKAREARERFEERERKHKQIKAQRDEERAQQQALIALRQEDYNSQEERRRQRNMEKQQELELIHQVNREKAGARQTVIKELSQQILEERRQMYEDKQARADLSRKAFEEFRDEQLMKHRQRAHQRERRIKDAQQRGHDIENYKIALALAKQEKADNARKKFEEERAAAAAEKRRKEEEKEARRKLIYETAKEEEQKKIQGFLHRQEVAAENQRRLKEEHDAEMALKMLDMKLKAADKRENVERMKKIYEYQKFKTLESIEGKIKKSNFIAAQTEELKQRRKQQRDEVERNKVFFAQTTPGPGEYLGPYVPSDKNIPAHGFGVARDDMILAQPGNSSPGPAAYVTKYKDRERKAWSMPKAERFGHLMGELGKGRKFIGH